MLERIKLQIERIIVNKMIIPYLWKVSKDSVKLGSCCMSYRHDYGLMKDDERRRLKASCRIWIESIAKGLSYSYCFQPNLTKERQE